MDGTDNREGRVEVCDSEVWGTVCDNGWDSFDAAVLCHQLGYGRQGVCVCVCVCVCACVCSLVILLLPFLNTGTALSNALFGPGSGPIFISDLGCSGSENRLDACTHTGVGQHNCVHNEDAGVRCTGKLS